MGEDTASIPPLILESFEEQRPVTHSHSNKGETRPAQERPGMVSAKQYRQFEGRVPTLGLKQRANEAERDIKLRRVLR
jgi:hypothetical protein